MKQKLHKKGKNSGIFEDINSFFFTFCRSARVPFCPARATLLSLPILVLIQCMSRFSKVVFALVLFGAPLFAQAQPVTTPFTFNVLQHDLPMVRHGSISWGDIDGDSDLDLYLSGESETGIVSGIYVNEGRSPNGNGHFVLHPSPIKPAAYSFSSWADVDGDGDLDLLVAGSETLSYPYSVATRIYQNNGSTFSEISVGFPGLHSGSASWGDIDKDGDLDVVLTGVNGADESVSIVAKNRGGAQFDIDTNMLPGLGYGDSALGDLDKDGDLDLVLSGAGPDGFTTRRFANNAGQFSAVAGELGAYAFSSVDLGDYDGDGDLDLLVGGGAVSSKLLTGNVTLWSNSGGTLVAVPQSFEGVLGGDITWGDYDQDGDLDVLLLGAVEVLGKRNARIYRNDGGSFVNTSVLVGSIFSDVEWADFDADGDLDLFSTGYTPYAQSTTNIYLNERQVRPTLPAAPAIQDVKVENGVVSLRWNSANQVDPANLIVSYNVRVGSTPGSSDIVSSMSDFATGRLQLPKPGNAESATSLDLENLPDGTYYWSVQSVNNAFLASSFSSESSFVVSGSFVTDVDANQQLPMTFQLKGSYPNPFTERAHIQFDLPEPSSVTLRVYSVLGQQIVELTPGVLAAGTHALEWTGRDRQGQQMSSGVYWFELRAGKQSKTGSLTLVR